MRRSAFLLSSAVALAASASIARAKPFTDPRVRAGNDIVIKDVDFVVPSGNAPVSSLWYIVTLAFTNSTAYPFIARLGNFAFETSNGNVIKAVVTGSPDLIGITNPHVNDILKPGATFEYQVGFLVGQGVAGFVYYDRTAGA